jgi:hypothetical protein
MPFIFDKMLLQLSAPGAYGQFYKTFLCHCWQDLSQNLRKQIDSRVYYAEKKSYNIELCTINNVTAIPQ